RGAEGVGGGQSPARGSRPGGRRLTCEGAPGGPPVHDGPPRRGFHDPPLHSTHREYRIFPPTIVYTTFAVGISSSGIFRMSFESTVMSAYLPTFSEPRVPSSNAA